ncbi:hypothetical protein BH11PSE11_BH11PSE11_28460 [soil metagenome]
MQKLNFAYRACCVFLCALALSSLTGCANFYVDTGLKDLKSEQIKKAESPKPVQLLFEFQSKGATNPRATENLKSKVAELVRSSGLFSEVGEAPVANGAMLNLIVNNVPITDNAFGKGFVTGFTFGLAGNTVTDGYLCTVEYVSGPGAAKITKTVRHAIHTTVGAEKAPANAEKSETIADAVNKMMRQIVNNALNEISTDAAFK